MLQSDQLNLQGSQEILPWATVQHLPPSFTLIPLLLGSQYQDLWCSSFLLLVYIHHDGPEPLLVPITSYLLCWILHAG